MTISEERPYPLLFTLCSCFGAFRANAKIGRGRAILKSIANLEIRQRLEGINGAAFGYFDLWYNWANVIGQVRQRTETPHVTGRQPFSKSH